MKALGFLFNWVYSSLISDNKWLSDRPKCESVWLRQAALKNRLENSYLEEKQKFQIFFDLYIAQTLFFQMRYDALPNSERQQSDCLRGWGTSYLHITQVLLFSLLFLLPLRQRWPNSLYILVCHSVTSCEIPGYRTPFWGGVLYVWYGTNKSAID